MQVVRAGQCREIDLPHVGEQSHSEVSGLLERWQTLITVAGPERAMVARAYASPTLSRAATTGQSGDTGAIEALERSVMIVGRVS